MRAFLKLVPLGAFSIDYAGFYSCFLPAYLFSLLLIAFGEMCNPI